MELWSAFGVEVPLSLGADGEVRPRGEARARRRLFLFFPCSGLGNFLCPPLADHSHA